MCSAERRRLLAGTHGHIERSLQGCHQQQARLESLAARRPNSISRWLASSSNSQRSFAVSHAKPIASPLGQAGQSLEQKPTLFGVERHHAVRPVNWSVGGFCRCRGDTQSVVQACRGVVGHEGPRKVGAALEPPEIALAGVPKLRRAVTLFASRRKTGATSKQAKTRRRSCRRVLWPREVRSRLRVLGRPATSSPKSIPVRRRRAKGSTSASGAKHLWAATAAGLPARRRQTICCGERGAQP